MEIVDSLRNRGPATDSGERATADHLCLLSLPEEVLSNICGQLYKYNEGSIDLFDVANAKGRIFRDLYNAQAVAPLTGVCQKFRRTATPWLYSTLSVTNAVDPERTLKSTSLLHRTLKENEDLRAHCRTVIIMATRPSQRHVRLLLDRQEPLEDEDFACDEHFSILKDIVTWSSRTTKLWLGMKRSRQDNRQLIALAVRSMPNLVELPISGDPAFEGSKVLDIRDIIGALNVPQSKADIRSLCLNHVALPKDAPEADATEGSNEPLRETATTRRLDELALESIGPRTIEFIATWIRPRSKLSFYRTASPSAQWINARQLRMLSHHKDSLTSLSILKEIRGGFDIGDLISLANLHTLRLSSEATHSWEFLLGLNFDLSKGRLPNLSTFIWTIDEPLREYLRPGTTIFPSWQEAWLRDILRYLAAHPTSHRIKNFHIDAMLHAKKDDSAPWVRSEDAFIFRNKLETLARIYRFRGIELTWDLPFVGCTGCP